jgi:hypothetical protein
LIKVFLSYQYSDVSSAAYVARRLKIYNDIDSYLDIIDPYIGRPDEDPAAHIQAQMEKYIQQSAAIFDAAKASQWVPWEIRVETENDYPLATYAAGNTLPPEFLRKWPYLRTGSHLDQHAIASKTARNTFIRKGAANLSKSVAVAAPTSKFYASLLCRLVQ